MLRAVLGANKAFPSPPAIHGLTNRTIIPIGDSITEGQTAGGGGTNKGSYRHFLYDTITAAGYTGWKFDGDTITDTSAFGPPLNQCRHSGHGGESYPVYQAALSARWQPHNGDVVLLHLGTNNTAAVVTECRNFLDAAMSIWPTDLILLMPKIIPSLVNANVATLNAAMPQIWSDYAAKTKWRIITGDMGQFFTTDMLSDGTHPDYTSGYPAMAACWWSMIQQIL